MVSWAVCLSGRKNKSELDWRSAGRRYRATCSSATNPGSTREIWAVFESLKSLCNLLLTSGRIINLLSGYEQQQLFPIPLSSHCLPISVHLQKEVGKHRGMSPLQSPGPWGWDKGEQHCTSLFLPAR